MKATMFFFSLLYLVVLRQKTNPFVKNVKIRNYMK
ncbi:hypothetical protein GLYMA_04G199650v4 [Glycine max]|nr:hypothetical protein GLYMA_04G199650v4 [Glycine max]KAH1112247.1 hypothetical protein GYH30_010524 [Glycine max]